jgi:hypothetical protein
MSGEASSPTAGKMSLQESPNYFCFVLEPPIFDDPRLRFVREPHPGARAKLDYIIGDQQFLVFDRAVFGWKEKGVKQKTARVLELERAATAVAGLLKYKLVQAEIGAIQPNVLAQVANSQNEVSSVPSLADLDKSGALKTAEE